jgi:hypothetical protein
MVVGDKQCKREDERRTNRLTGSKLNRTTDANHGLIPLRVPEGDRQKNQYLQALEKKHEETLLKIPINSVSDYLEFLQ